VAARKRKGMSIRGYAAHRRELSLDGGSAWSVQKALREGRISRLPDGSIDPERADAEWEANTHPGRGSGKRKGQGKSQPADPPGAESGPAAPSPEGKRFTYASARARLEEWKARKAELEYRRLAGELTSVAEVERATFNFHRTLREQILATAGRVAAECIPLRSARSIERVITRELRTALEELTADGPGDGTS